MRRRAMGLLLSVVTLAAAVTVTLTAEAATADPPGPGVTFTLITGDHVTDRDGQISVRPGPGRAAVTFIQQKLKNHRYVIPSDALPLLHADRIDRRLFDITTLKAYGYDKRMPLLTSASAAARSLAPAGIRSLETDAAGRAALWQQLTSTSLRGRIDHVWLDGQRKLSLDVSVPQIGAPAAWKAGLDGAGVTVAVLDSGIDATHPDLKDQISQARNFTTAPDTDDTVGHGTHVASTIAGTGAASGGRYRGVAPGAKLLVGKVCTDVCEDSDILAGMAWAAPLAPIVNMSLGGDDQPGLDPLELAVNDLTARYGTLFVIAAGNSPQSPVNSPASAESAVAVGAVDSDDRLADFSSIGPSVGGTVKPDITAPGVGIVAAKAAHHTIGGPAPLPGYSTLSGTSMATPHVSGAAAILVQQHPGWTARQRKAALMASAKPAAGPDVFHQGAGRVDVARAITQDVTAEPGSVSFADQLYPHTDDKPVTAAVTYRNDGAAPVTLALSVAGTAQDASALPAGAFTLAAPVLTVPAGGTASVDLTADPSAGPPVGYFAALLTAVAAGGVRVETPVGAAREGEKYDVAFVRTGRDAKAPVSQFTGLTNIDDSYFYVEDTSADATATVRVPKGNYGLLSQMTGADGSTTELVQPTLLVDHDLTVELDARQGKPVTVTVPAAGAQQVWGSLEMTWSYGFNVLNQVTIARKSLAGVYTAQIGPGTAADTFDAVTGAWFADGKARNSAYSYNLVWHRHGLFWTGFTRRLKPGDLATVRSAYAKEAAGVTGTRSFGARLLTEDSVTMPHSQAELPFDLPFRRTDYVNADAGVSWQTSLSQQAADGPFVGYSGRTPDYRPGKVYAETWNQAPLAIAAGDGDTAVGRDGDVVRAYPITLTDRAGDITTSAAATWNYALYAGGRRLEPAAGDDPFWTLPADSQNYRLEATVTRAAPHALTTSASSVWTFASAHTGVPSALPLTSVRLAPPLDRNNTAPRGVTFAVPLTVVHQTAVTTRTITAEVSFDDGRTWTPARVTGLGERRVASLCHPAAAGFASLRVSITDSAGNTLTQTVIRAYGIE